MYINDDFNTPMMYRDIGNSSMMPFPGLPMYGMGMYGGFQPGLTGIRMNPQLTKDSFSISEAKDKKDGRLLKTLLLIAGGLVGYKFIKSKVFGKKAAEAIQGAHITESVKNWISKSRHEAGSLIQRLRTLKTQA